MCDWREVHGGQRSPSLHALHARACSDGTGRCEPAQRWAFLAPSPESAGEGQAQGFLPRSWTRGRTSGHGSGAGRVCWESFRLFLVPFLWLSHHSKFPRCGRQPASVLCSRPGFLLRAQQARAEPLSPTELRRACGVDFFEISSLPLLSSFLLSVSWDFHTGTLLLLPLPPSPAPAGPRNTCTRAISAQGGEAVVASRWVFFWWPWVSGSHCR